VRGGGVRGGTKKWGTKKGETPQGTKKKVGEHGRGVTQKKNTVMETKSMRGGDKKVGGHHKGRGINTSVIEKHGKKKMNKKVLELYWNVDTELGVNKKVGGGGVPPFRGDYRFETKKELG